MSVEYVSLDFEQKPTRTFLYEVQTFRCCGSAGISALPIFCVGFTDSRPKFNLDRIKRWLLLFTPFARIYRYFPITVTLSTIVDIIYYC